MIRRTGIAASLLIALIMAAPAARADDPVKDIMPATGAERPTAIIR